MAPDYELLRLAFELLVSGFAAVLWWNFRALNAQVLEANNKQDLLHKDYNDLRYLIATEYVKHSDLDKLNDKIDGMASRVENKLEKIFDLIDRKADKP